MRAIWNDQVVAESKDTVVVEGNHYFPPEAMAAKYFEPSNHSSICAWKGTASYYSLVVNGKRNENAAWYYTEPKPAAKEIRGRVAFWKGVEVRE
jgi:uncharacterized protein (DUF427 family)